MPDKLNPLFFFSPDSGSGSGPDGEEGDEGEAPGGSGTSEPPVGTPEAEAVAETKRLKRESQDLRKRLRDAEKERDDLKAATQTDLEKTQKERDDLKMATSEQDLKIRNLRVQVLGGSAGITESARADAANLLDWSKIPDADDDGEVTNALKELVKAKPYLAGNLADGADGGSGGNGTSGGQDMNSLIRAAAGR